MIKPTIEEINNPPLMTELFDRLRGHPYCFFLDSASDPGKLGRFSFLGCDPFFVFKTNGTNPFPALKKLFQKYNIVTSDKELPLTSGIVGYFGYDLKNFIEEVPDTAIDDLDLPDCILGFYDVVIIRDNLKAKTYIASSGLPETDPVKNDTRKISRLNEFKNILFTSPVKKTTALPFVGPSSLKSNFTRTKYAKAVETAKDYIKKGDIYQVNLSQRFETKFRGDPALLYERLRQLSPAPFASYLDFEDVVVLSSSPERFLRKTGDCIETRPIKGTRPRGEDEFSDALLEKELVESAKDRAEHIMIVDLERNDLGRICEYGSVKPIESFVLEKYANVFHLVSTVAGKLKKNIEPIYCLMATFPGGSITGAPKIRSMEIIDSLEPVRRSIYTGAAGYISFDGNMDTSIVIRTFVIKGDDIYFQVGGGIVADSDPEGEYEETLYKAKGLMEALGLEAITNNQFPITK